jgi:hypothetical protein
MKVNKFDVFEPIGIFNEAFNQNRRSGGHAVQVDSLIRMDVRKGIGGRHGW